MEAARKYIPWPEVQNHTSERSCWVVLYGVVWDVTTLLSSHPGGLQAIIDLAGTDATEEYDSIHASGTLEANLPPTARIGEIDPDSMPRMPEPEHQTVVDGSFSSPLREEADELEETASLTSILNLDEIERAARKKLSPKTWAYYFSATDDSITKFLNNNVYQSILLRPRVLVDCSKCDLTTTFLGYKLSHPVYVSPAAMARLAHPAGERGIAQACQTFGAMQLISNFASMQPEQIVENAPTDQVFGWQLYVQNDLTKSEQMLARVDKIDAIKFICLTLDVPVTGKREDDERNKLQATTVTGRKAGPRNQNILRPGLAQNKSVTQTLGGGNSTKLTWVDTLPWLCRHTTKPIVLKGIQTYEDAMLAASHARMVKGIILSNHGGRALDTAAPSIHTLLEIRKYCPEVLARMDVLIDGGIRRGTDVVKALSLGAKAVGVGRSPLYGLAAGGVRGVERVFEILRDEITTAMRLLGCETVSQLGQRCINTAAMERDIYTGPEMKGPGWGRCKL